MASYSNWRRQTRRVRRRRMAAGGVLVAALVVSFWASSSPRRAVGHRRTTRPEVADVASAPGLAATNPAGLSTRPWTAILAGSLRQRGPDPSGAVTVTVSGRLSGSRRGTLTIVMLGLAAGGGVSLQHSIATLDLSGGARWSGQVAALSGDAIVAAVGAGSSHLDLGIDLQVDPSTADVTGSVHAAPVIAGSAPLWGR
jgi:hypothetical protein